MKENLNGKPSAIECTITSQNFVKSNHQRFVERVGLKQLNGTPHAWRVVPFLRLSTTGRRCEMDLKPLSMSCLCEAKDGSIREFDVLVYEPFAVDADEWACAIACKAIQKQEFKIRGETAQQAYALALRFIQQYLDHAEQRLVDKSGNPVTLPRYEEHER